MQHFTCASSDSSRLSAAVCVHTGVSTESATGVTLLLLLAVLLLQVAVLQLSLLSLLLLG
jgi:hypothetical protein